MKKKIITCSTKQTRSYKRPQSWIKMATEKSLGFVPVFIPTITAPCLHPTAA